VKGGPTTGERRRLIMQLMETGTSACQICDTFHSDQDVFSRHPGCPRRVLGEKLNPATNNGWSFHTQAFLDLDLHLF
jgi:hypothetical protein